VLDTDVAIAALDRADAHHRATARAFERWAAEDVDGFALATAMARGASVASRLPRPSKIAP
jgi:predicted nucleic acid-binding protein